MSRISPPARPLAIAHRAGNDLAALRAAEEAGVDLIEADIWLYRDAIEVRHLKTMGPIPLLWDRWKLAPGWTPRLSLPDLLAAAHPSTGLMLDLKGTSLDLATAIIEMADRGRPGRPITVCSQNWRLLAPFRGRPRFQIVHSVGSAEQMRRVLPYLIHSEHRAISIHARLLSPAVVAALREHVEILMTWPVNTPDLMRTLLGWGVNGIISDDLRLLRTLAPDHMPSGDGGRVPG